MNRWILFLFALCAVYGKLSAQNFYAQVSSKKVQVGVAFEYAVVISVNATNFVAPNFKDFDVVSGPNQSNSYQYANGTMSQQLIVSYGLVAKKEGKFTIGAASVVSGNQKLETAPIVIEALKGSASQNSAGGNDAGQNKISGGDIFITTRVSKTQCYLGEQISITQKLYSRYQIIALQKFTPTYEGFYSQGQEPRATPQQVINENVDGVMYQTYEIFKTYAIASKSGKITLTPIEGDVVIRRQANAKPRNVFEQFFGAASYEDLPVSVKSKAIAIEVMELPEDGKPTSFNGAVGNYTYKLQATRNELKANEAFNLKMTISGKGNLKLLSAPKLELPEGFETYDPKTSEAPGSKTFDFLVIPRNEGSFLLSNLDFSYFNLDTKKYVTLPGGELSIKVLPADPNSAGAQVYTPQSQVKETENDIRYIKKGDFLLIKTDTEFFNSFMHLLLLGLILMGLGIGLFIRSTHIKNNSNMIVVKERKAARAAKKQLENAQRLMDQNKKDEFYTEILTALNNYLSHKLNIPVSDLSRENVQKALGQKNIDSGLVSKLAATLETSEYAKYAPGAVSGDLRAVYADTVELVTGLEQQLNKKA